MKKFSIVALISGRGSNLKAIIDAANPLVDISAVISNRPEAAGLSYAQEAGISADVLDHKDFATRLEFDTALQECIDKYEPQLVVLAGFMRILSSEFVKHYKGRLINIHPSLLPKFKGLDTHKRAIEAGEKEHGATVHFVTEDLDAGAIILQARVPILADDTEESLAARVLQEEHKIYPEAIELFAKSGFRADRF